LVFNELKYRAGIKIVLYRLSCQLSILNEKNMKISIKNQSEIQKMRIAGKLASEVLEMIEPYVIPGVSTEELDRRCYEHIVNVQIYKKSIRNSKNENCRKTCI